METRQVHEILDDLERVEKYQEWREGLPLGYLLEKQMEANKKNIIGIEDQKIYEYEKTHIAVPIDYYCTVPDITIRWKL